MGDSLGIPNAVNLDVWVMLWVMSSNCQSESRVSTDVEFVVFPSTRRFGRKVQINLYGLTDKIQINKLLFSIHKKFENLNILFWLQITSKGLIKRTKQINKNFFLHSQLCKLNYYGTFWRNYLNCFIFPIKFFTVLNSLILFAS